MGGDSGLPGWWGIYGAGGSVKNTLHGGAGADKLYGGELADDEGTVGGVLNRLYGARTLSHAASNLPTTLPLRALLASSPITHVMITSMMMLMRCPAGWLLRPARTPVTHRRRGR